MSRLRYCDDCGSIDTWKDKAWAVILCTPVYNFCNCCQGDVDASTCVCSPVLVFRWYCWCCSVRHRSVCCYNYSCLQRLIGSVLPSSHSWTRFAVHPLSVSLPIQSSSLCPLCCPFFIISIHPISVAASSTSSPFQRHGQSFRLTSAAIFPLSSPTLLWNELPHVGHYYFCCVLQCSFWHRGWIGGPSGIGHSLSPKGTFYNLLT